MRIVVAWGRDRLPPPDRSVRSYDFIRQITDLTRVSTFAINDRYSKLIIKLIFLQSWNESCTVVASRVEGCRFLRVGSLGTIRGEDGSSTGTDPERMPAARSKSFSLVNSELGGCHCQRVVDIYSIYLTNYRSIDRSNDRSWHGSMAPWSVLLEYRRLLVGPPGRTTTTTTTTPTTTTKMMP